MRESIVIIGLIGLNIVLFSIQRQLKKWARRLGSVR